LEIFPQALERLRLARALYLVSNPFLVATSGVLHAAGKFGSAFGVRGELLFPWRNLDASALCRNVVLISSIPAIIATTADFFSSKARDDGAFAFNSLALLACYLIWAIADSMLLPQDSVVVRSFRGTWLRKSPFSDTVREALQEKASHASLSRRRFRCGRRSFPRPRPMGEWQSHPRMGQVDVRTGGRASSPARSGHAKRSWRLLRPRLPRAHRS
jgi:hypothetical protein